MAGLVAGTSRSPAFRTKSGYRPGAGQFGSR